MVDMARVVVDIQKQPLLVVLAFYLRNGISVEVNVNLIGEKLDRSLHKRYMEGQVENEFLMSLLKGHVSSI